MSLHACSLRLLGKKITCERSSARQQALARSEFSRAQVLVDRVSGQPELPPTSLSNSFRAMILHHVRFRASEINFILSHGPHSFLSLSLYLARAHQT